MASAAKRMKIADVLSADKIRMCLRHNYDEIKGHLVCDELCSKLFSKSVLKQEDLENLICENRERGVTAQAKLLLNKLLIKEDHLLEIFCDVIKVTQPHVHQLLMLDNGIVLESRLTDIGEHVKSIYKNRNYDIVNALPGEDITLELRNTEYMMPIMFQAEKIVIDNMKPNLIKQVPKRYREVKFESLEEVVSTLTQQDTQAKVTRRVLFNGIAGIGKSIASQKLLVSWVEKKELSAYKLVLLIPIRDVDIHRSFLEIVSNDQKGLGLIVHKDSYIELCLKDEVTACKILVIIDGIDEKDIPEDSELYQILTGTKYPHIKLVITARPEATFFSQVPNFDPDYKLDLKGTNTEGVYSYLKNIMRHVSDNPSEDNIVEEPSKEKIDDFVNRCQNSMIDFELLHIPLYLTLVGLLLKDNQAKHIPFTNFIVPKTQTDLFNSIMLILLRKWLERRGSVNEAKELNFQNNNPISYESNLPNKLKTILVLFGHISFDFLHNKQYTFNEKELKRYKIDKSDLCDSGLFCTSEQDNQYVCFYKHKTLQEYMAALFLSDSESMHISDSQFNNLWLNNIVSNALWLKRTTLLEAFSGFEVVLKFLFGLDSKLSKKILDKLAENLCLQRISEKREKSGPSVLFESDLFSEIQDQKLKTTMLQILINAKVIFKTYIEFKSKLINTYTLCDCFTKKEAEC